MKATQLLTTQRVYWEVMSDNKIKTCCIGPLTEYHTQMEARLFKLGLIAIRRTYDKKNNRISTIYKQTNVRY